MIKAIVFDFAGVVAPGIILGWVKKHLSQDDPRYRLFKQASAKWDMGEVSVDEFYNLLSKISGINTMSIEKELYAKATYHPEVIEIIKKLKLNYKIVLFSNNFAHSLYKIIDKNDLRKLFDFIVISSEYKMKKPSPQFFNKMLEIVGLNKEEVIFIDDTTGNVDAGNNLGITSFVYKSPEQLISDLKSLQIKI